MTTALDDDDDNNEEEVDMVDRVEGWLRRVVDDVVIFRSGDNVVIFRSGDDSDDVILLEDVVIFPSGDDSDDVIFPSGDDVVIFSLPSLDYRNGLWNLSRLTWMMLLVQGHG